MKSRLYFALACFLAVSFGAGFPTSAQQSDAAIASLQGRPSPEWLKSGVICRIFARSFSLPSDLKGVSAHLDDLQAAGNWKAIELPASKPEPAAVPFLSLNAFEACIFQKQAR